MSMTSDELRAARDQLRGLVREPDANGNVMLAVEAAQGLAPRGLLDLIEDLPADHVDDGNCCAGTLADATSKSPHTEESR